MQEVLTACFCSSSTSGGFPGMNPSVTAWRTEVTTVNGSEGPLQETFQMETPIMVLLTVIVSLVGLAGNAVVLWLLGFRIRRNAFSVYVLNLAGADFLFLCSHVIWALELLIDYFHSISIQILPVFMVVSVFTYISGLSILSTISSERCLSVLWPIWYRCRRPRHMSAVICALLWALSLLLSFMEGNYCSFLTSDLNHVSCQVIEFITAAWLLLLFVLLSGSSLALVTRLLCGSQPVRLTRLYVTIILTVLVFLLCGLPFGIHWFFVFWMYDDVFYFQLQRVAILLSCVNSCANPIIYFFVGSFRQRWWTRRQTLRLVLLRALQDTPELDEHGGSPPQETLEMSGTSLMS